MLKPISMVELTEELKKIKEKLDRIFLEFAARSQETADVNEFLMPLLLAGYQEDRKKKAEASWKRFLQKKRKSADCCQKAETRCST